MYDIPAEEHKDILGREVREGDHVAFTHHNTLYVGQVVKVTPKQVNIQPLGFKRYNDKGYLKYTKQCCLVGGPELTYMILKHG